MAVAKASAQKRINERRGEIADKQATVVARLKKQIAAVEKIATLADSWLRVSRQIAGWKKRLPSGEYAPPIGEARPVIDTLPATMYGASVDDNPRAVRVFAALSRGHSLHDAARFTDVIELRALGDHDAAKSLLAARANDPRLASTHKLARKLAPRFRAAVDAEIERLIEIARDLVGEREDATTEAMRIVESKIAPLRHLLDHRRLLVRRR